MTIALSDRHLAMVTDILRHHLPERDVWLFGSRANGTAGPTSDIDLCIASGEALGSERRANLKLAFSESNIPFVVDIVERATSSPSFFDRIQQTKPIPISVRQCQ